MEPGRRLFNFNQVEIHLKIAYACNFYSRQWNPWNDSVTKEEIVIRILKEGYLVQVAMAYWDHLK